MVLDTETPDSRAYLVRCDSCPYDVAGTTWAWVQARSNDHTRGQHGHRMVLA